MFSGVVGYWFAKFIQTSGAFFHRDGWTRWLQVILCRACVVIGSAVGEGLFLFGNCWECEYLTLVPSRKTCHDCEKKFH